MKLWGLATLGAVALAIGAVSRHAEAPLTRAAGQVGALMAPVRRSRNILVRVYEDAMQARLFAVAAGVAFYALLALVPSLAAAVSLFGLVADPETLTKLPEQLTTILPSAAITLVQSEAQRLASQPAQTLSLKLGLALCLSLWGSSAAVRATFDALNVIDGQQETRSIVRLYATALGATLAAILLFVLTVTLIGANPQFLALGLFSRESVYLYGLLRWPAFFVLGVVVLAAIYWIGPSRPPARFVRLLPGAVFAALFASLGSWGFGYYVATLGNYTATYGSLATVAVLMTWLWLSAAIVLLGAEINCQLARR